MTSTGPGPVERRLRERLYHRIFGIYSHRVVDERMAEDYRVREINRQRMANYQREQERQDPNPPPKEIND